MQPYPQYKDSDLPWVGRIPEHWVIKPLKRWVNINSRTLSEMTNPDFTFRYVDISSVQTGYLVKKPQLICFSEAPSRARRILQRGDTVISTVRTYLKAIWHVGEDANNLIASTGFAVLTPGKEVISEYLAYAIQSNVFINQVTANSIGIAYPAIAETVLGRFGLALPPLPEQTQIATYLRSQDAKIARFIRIKRELIEKLNEQKLRLIDHAITGGLDTSGKRKPSGVAWLGDVPGHWEVSLIKHVTDVRFSGVDKHSFDDEIPVRLCNYTDVYKNDRITDDMDLMHATATQAEIARLTLQAGDVILTKDSESADDIGVPAWVPHDLPDVVCAYHLALLRPQPQRVSGEFLFRAIGSLRIARQFHVLANGVTRFALGKHDVKNAIIPLPPLEEQQTILAHIQKETAPLAAAITQAEKEITLIREYRERLIQDCVSGQIDLRGWQGAADDTLETDLAALAEDDSANPEAEDMDDNA